MLKKLAREVCDQLWGKDAETLAGLVARQINKPLVPWMPRSMPWEPNFNAAQRGSSWDITGVPHVKLISLAAAPVEPARKASHDGEHGGQLPFKDERLRDDQPRPSPRADVPALPPPPRRSYDDRYEGSSRRRQDDYQPRPRDWDNAQRQNQRTGRDENYADQRRRDNEYRPRENCHDERPRDRDYDYSGHRDSRSQGAWGRYHDSSRQYDRRDDVPEPVRSRSRPVPTPPPNPLENRTYRDDGRGRGRDARHDDSPSHRYEHWRPQVPRFHSQPYHDREGRR